MGTLVVAAVALLTITTFAMRSSWFHTRFGQSFRILSGNMEPLLREGDFLFAKPLNRPVAHGDVVVRKNADGTTIIRIVGLPGDTIAMLNGELFVNKRPVAEPYALNDTGDFNNPQFAWQAQYLAPNMQPKAYRPTLQNWGPMGIPAHQYFALGDNRLNSLDSRYFGFIAQDEIVARAASVYSSGDSTKNDIRWARLGREISTPPSADTIDVRDTTQYFDSSFTQRQILFYSQVMRALKEPSLDREMHVAQDSRDSASVYRVVNMRSFEPAVVVRATRRRGHCDVVTIIMHDSEIVWSAPDTTSWSVAIGSRPGKDVRRDSAVVADSLCAAFAHAMDQAFQQAPSTVELPPSPVMDHVDQWIFESVDRTGHRAFDALYTTTPSASALRESARLAFGLGRVVPPKRNRE